MSAEVGGPEPDPLGIGFDDVAHALISEALGADGAQRSGRSSGALRHRSRSLLQEPDSNLGHSLVHSGIASVAAAGETDGADSCQLSSQTAVSRRHPTRIARREQVRARQVRCFCSRVTLPSIAVCPPTVAEIDDATTATVVGDCGRWPRHVFTRISGWVGVLPFDIDWRCGVHRAGVPVIGRSPVSRPLCPVTGCSVSRSRRPVTRRPVTWCPVTRCAVCNTRCHIRGIACPGPRCNVDPCICDINSPRRHVHRLQFACHGLRRR